MRKLTINHKSWSCSVFPEYYMAITKAQNFLEDINLNGELGDCIYHGNGTMGSYCIIYLKFNTFTLSVNLNIENGKHRVDTTVSIIELPKQFGNYYTYTELIEKIKEVSTTRRDERLDL